MPYGLHDLIMSSISIQASDCRKFFVLHITHTMVYLTLRLSETINPIIYIYGSQALRKGFKLRCASRVIYYLSSLMLYVRHLGNKSQVLVCAHLYFSVWYLDTFPRQKYHIVNDCQRQLRQHSFIQTLSRLATKFSKK